MTELTFNTGRRAFNINGVVEVSFNDTDVDFVERLYSVFAKLDEKQDYYKTRVQTTPDGEIFSLMRDLDSDMREELNGLFETDVCTPLFGRMNVFALADGLPLWANLMLCIMEQVDAAYSREQKAINPRVQKYTAKWQKK